MRKRGAQLAPSNLALDLVAVMYGGGNLNISPHISLSYGLGLPCKAQFSLMQPKLSHAPWPTSCHD